MARKFTVTFDAADPARLGAFWALALGYREDHPPQGFKSWDAALDAFGVPPENRNDAYAIIDADDPTMRIFFQKVPEPKTAKNRVHLDVRCGERGPDGLKDWAVLRVEAARLVEAGAAIEREFDEAGMGQWIVMHDPEGNEFCVV